MTFKVVYQCPLTFCPLTFCSFYFLKAFSPTDYPLWEKLSRKSPKYHITSLPHVGSSWPKTWTTVREKLENNQSNYISKDEYLTICEENGFKQDKHSLQLSQFLHDLGVILHFQDNLILSETVILKPEWGTDAVYKVLDNTTVKQNFGKFTNEDLSNIWSEKQYTRMLPRLLELMMKFKLCYKLPDSESTYIAPQLLDYNQPNYKWDDNNNLLLRYKYDFIPKGIITRFIVEMNRHIVEPNVWRNGVLLVRDDTYAEVIESYNKKEIKVRLSGSNKRGFLEVITDKLDEIHSSYHRLKVDKLIPCNCSICKNNQNPEFYPFEKLQKFRIDNQKYIQCQTSYQMVNVKGLIDDIFGNKPTPEENSDAIHIWKEKLAAYLKEEAITSDPSKKFELKKLIKECLNKIESLENQNTNKTTKDILEIASTIQALLDQLSQTYPTETKKEQRSFAAEAMNLIEDNTPLVQSIVKVIKAGQLEAIANKLNHPAKSSVVKQIEDLEEDT